jgi:hypothetical protein
MIEQVFQRAGVGSAIDRASNDHAVCRAYTLDDRAAVSSLCCSGERPSANATFLSARLTSSISKGLFATHSRYREAIASR